MSSIYFLHRVHPRPDDLSPTIGRLNRFAQERFDSGVQSRGDQETVAQRARRMRYAANHIVRHGLGSRSRRVSDPPRGIQSPVRLGYADPALADDWPRHSRRMSGIRWASLTMRSLRFHSQATARWIRQNQVRLFSASNNWNEHLAPTQTRPSTRLRGYSTSHSTMRSLILRASGMPNRTDQLNVAAWALDQSASQIGLTRFMLPESIYGTLAQWAPKARNLSSLAYPAAVLSGLSEILAFFAPEIAYVNSRERYPSKQAGLALYMLAEKSSDGVVRTHIADAINFWLTILYPDKPVEMRMAIAATARDERNWQSVSVSTSLKAHAGVCAVPNETALFSVLTATAVVKLSGTRILFGSGDTRTLIAQTPQSSTFNGVELVAFPTQTRTRWERPIHRDCESQDGDVC